MKDNFYTVEQKKGVNETFLEKVRMRDKKLWKI